MFVRPCSHDSGRDRGETPAGIHCL